MRNPLSANPNQQSIYVKPSLWSWAKTAAKARGLTVSSLMVSLLEAERDSSTYPRRHNIVGPDADEATILHLSHAYEYVWAGMQARVDSPTVADLEAQGWTTEHIDPRYGTRLMKRRLT